MDPLRELLEFQRTVVEGGGQAEAVLDQRLLARPVAAVHRAHLRQRDVALVHEKQKILREIVQQRHRRAAGGAVGDHAGIVLDAGAVAELLHHFDVVIGTLADALRLEQLVVFLEILHALVALRADTRDGGVQLFARRDVVARGIDRRMVEIARHGARHDVDLADAVHLVAEEFHADRLVVGIGREDLHRVAADAEHVALEGDVVALVADLDELFQQLVKVAVLSRTERDDHVRVVDGVAETVDAGDRGHDDHVPPLEQARGGAVPQPLDLVVDRAVLLDEGVRVRDVGLRLVVVVIADKVLDRVFGKKLLELAAKLRRQRLVVREHQRRAVDARDDVGHREGLARAGHAEQHLLVDAVIKPGDERIDGLRLAARRLIFGM